MKYITWILVVLLLSNSVLADDMQKPEDINPILAVFLYESRAKPLIQDDGLYGKLAYLVSPEYGSARDEFTRHDLLEKLQPVIKSHLEESKGKNLFLLQRNIEVDEYDFKKNIFPTKVSESFFIPYYLQDVCLKCDLYGLQFENQEVLHQINATLDQARSFSERLRKNNRLVKAKIYFIISGTTITKNSVGSDVKMLLAKIVNVQYLF